MKRLVFILMVVAGARSASAQYGDYGYQISRSLDDISWELFMARLDRDYPLGGCGYFPVPVYRPSRHQIRDWNRRYYGLQRAEAVRAGTAKPVRRTVVK